MWVLDSDADLFGGKRIWLRPGTSHLFGRSQQKKENTRIHVVVHTSISRQHFELSVAPVEDGASSLLHAKTKLIIRDLGSKVGTSLDGQNIGKNATRTLDKSEHLIRLGSFEKGIRITWQPCILTFANVKRSSKQLADPLEAQRARLESLNIKCTTEFISQSTTHVLSKKRNTAQVLQALVHARYIVTEGFVDALVAVATVSSAEQTDNTLTKLEQDFDQYWPKAIEFLPPPSNEPNPRPNHDNAFLPNSTRSDMFRLHTFIFPTATQYDSLMSVVTGGGGKALLREIAPESEKPDLQDMLDYVKEVAGKKQRNDAFTLSQLPLDASIILIRPGDKTKAGGTTYWERLDSALEQRSMEQNEFLEAILRVDASNMRRPLELESAAGTLPIDLASRAQSPAVTQRVANETGVHASTMISNTQHAYNQQDPAPDKSPVDIPKRKIRQPVTKSRFAALDDFDDFDPTMVVKSTAAASQSMPSDFASQSSRRTRVQSSQFAAQPIDDSPPPPAASVKRKRAMDDVPVPDISEDDVDALMTGAAAMKKRKLEQEAMNAASQSQAQSQSQAAPPEPSQPELPTKASKKADVVKEAMKKRRQLAESTQQEDEIDVHAALQDMDINEAKNLAKVEEVDLLRRVPAPDTADDRWKPEWNGRPNFKKFRKARRGESHTADERIPRRKVIVQLTQYQPNSQHTAEEYWLEAPHANGQSQRGSQSRATPKAPETSFRRTQNALRQALGSKSTSQRDSGGMLGEEDISMSDDGSRNLRPSQQAQSASTRKRVAPDEIAQPPAKRVSRLAAIPIDDDSDEDDGEVKFRRRRR